MPAATNSKHIVVVGGGIIGCSTAYHLLKSGVKTVTLVEATEPGAATTSAGAGFVSHWSAGMIPAGEEGLRLQQYGLDFYRMLSELGTEIGYRPNGTLIMALTPQGREDFVMPVLSSPYAPKEMQDLNAAQIGEKMGGLVDPAKVHSGAYNPHGIQVDTKLALGVLVNEIKKLGGVVRDRTKVRKINDIGGKVTLETDRDVIEADGVVVAAGAWNNEVLASLDWHLPLLRVLATRVVTDDRGLPSALPTIQCRELRLWLRETFGAIMWGTGSHYTPMHRLEESEPEPGQPHNRELMQSMVDHQMEKLQEVFPPLRGSKVANWSQGIPCYTPDVGLMVGHVPGHANIVVVGGDNETGVSHGPGLGRLATEILLDAPRFVDPARFRIDRYARDAFPSEVDVEASMPAWSARHGARRFATAAE
ncbi:FAD-binding oxidoreductase [Mesorhizobium sp. VK25A]|uniref:FAD-binding oxidoreductase n=1 Tax=Mesorhizobium vachelliae TaxID=3072309 RepID=A0ABU5ABL1_9HYPH|nr:MULTISPECIES: FAD-binding oxidoreductase [unclassified Mesorhizobium]MDX8533919.1 FAD-binding oxidoreductase [Mesorhizobium sp. VK25D]MDX8546610.1 FAD-binding oxidoreductase [Mesorhizobium sp. VK25A]